MYIGKFGKGKNVYVRLMECYRDEETGKNKIRVLKNFGRYEDLIKDDPLAYEKLQEQYREERDKTKIAIRNERLSKVEQVLNLQNNKQKKFETLPALKYGHYILKSIWENNLGLYKKINILQSRNYKNTKYNINDALSYLVFNRIIAPYSILRQYAEKDCFLGNPIKDISLDDLYHCLDFAKESKNTIMKWVNDSIDKEFGKNRATLVFYDVTNCYFESQLTDYERNLEQKDYLENIKILAKEAVENGELPEDSFDEDNNLIINDTTKKFIDGLSSEKIQFLKMRGPSKEHRFDLPIVSIALVIDKNGFPMDFCVYAGNDSEFATLKKSIKEFKEKYIIDDIIVSADRGINSVENLNLLKSFGFGFVVAQKVSQFSGDLYNLMIDKNNYTPFDYSNPEKGGYLVIDEWTKTGSKGKSITCTLVITYDEKRHRRDEAILNTWKTIVENKIHKGEKLGPRKSGWATLAKIDNEKIEYPIIKIDQEVYEKQLKLCGYAALVYSPSIKSNNSKNTPISPSQIALMYKKQSEIESCFRILKYNLDIRPMYVWTSNHIRGHVTICVLSLILLKFIQFKLQETNVLLSINQICQIIREASLVVLNLNDENNTNLELYGIFEYKRYRKGFERMNEEAIEQALKEELILRNGVYQIMKAVGLTPLPGLCTRHELARSLRTRFHSLADAVPRLALL